MGQPVWLGGQFGAKGYGRFRRIPSRKIKPLVNGAPRPNCQQLNHARLGCRRINEAKITQPVAVNVVVTGHLFDGVPAWGDGVLRQLFQGVDDRLLQVPIQFNKIGQVGRFLGDLPLVHMKIPA